jgi:hypothetical protein
MNLNALRLLFVVFFLASCRNTVGADCQTNADCGGGDLFCSTNQPGGYCTQSCARANDCPAGSVCLFVDGDTRSYCFETCQSGRECRPGYHCNAVSDSNEGFCF